jgi:hypothetical protein
MNRRFQVDMEIAEHFNIEPKPTQDETDPLAALEYVVKCKHCQPEKARAWELTLSVDGTIDRGSRTALLQHARAHFDKPRLRPIRD